MHLSGPSSIASSRMHLPGKMTGSFRAMIYDKVHMRLAVDSNDMVGDIGMNPFSRYRFCLYFVLKLWEDLYIQTSSHNRHPAEWNVSVGKQT